MGGVGFHPLYRTNFVSVDPFPEATAPRTPTMTAPKELTVTVTYLPLDHHDLLALWDYHSSVEFPEPEPAPVDERVYEGCED